MNPYKCNTHNPSTASSMVSCLGCINSIYNINNRMRGFIKSLMCNNLQENMDNEYHSDECELTPCEEAYKLLSELLENKGKQ